MAAMRWTTNIFALSGRWKTIKSFDDLKKEKGDEPPLPGYKTADAINWWLRDQGLLDDDDMLWVEGRVAFPDGRPAAERRVVAYSVDVSGAKEELAAAVTERDGRYTILYSEDGGPRLRGPTVSLRVVVPDAAHTMCFTSPGALARVVRPFVAAGREPARRDVA